jgi:hypothetical protein
MRLPRKTRRRREGPTGQDQAAPLAEYLFVDDVRLDTYFQQISSPVAYDNVPVYNGSLALTGPRVGTETQNHPRAFTLHEKLETVVDYLKRGEFVATSRQAVDQNKQHVFRLETCRGTRALLPLPGSDRVLAIWVCDPPPNQDPSARRAIGQLYLIEDFPGVDFDGAFFRRASGYSALLMLLEDEDADVRETICRAGLNPSQSAAFASQPLELLTKLGAKVGTTRTIRTLYRIRDTVMEQYAEPEYAVVTIGYPIAIAVA